MTIPNIRQRAGVPVSRPRVRDLIPGERDVRFEEDARLGVMAARFAAFHTDVSLKVAGSGCETREALELLVLRCRYFEWRLSRTLPHSDVSRINAAGGRVVEVDRQTSALVEAALRYCEASGGVFDITAGTMTSLWDFARRIEPSTEALREAVRHVGWRGVHAGDGWVRLNDPGARIDLGGIAKGWIADDLGRILQTLGFRDYLIDLGGNLLAHGCRPDGHPWRAGVSDPRTGGFADVVELRDAALSTSGVAARSFSTADGTVLHHILDPASGRPTRINCVAVTVLADRSIDAEGWSTTLLAVGSTRGMRIVSGRPELRTVYFLTADGRTLVA